jgi:hypothetical protein
LHHEEHPTIVNRHEDRILEVYLEHALGPVRRIPVLQEPSGDTASGGPRNRATGRGKRKTACVIVALVTIQAAIVWAIAAIFHGSPPGADRHAGSSAAHAPDAGGRSLVQGESASPDRRKRERTSPSTWLFLRTGERLSNGDGSEVRARAGTVLRRGDRDAVYLVRSGDLDVICGPRSELTIDTTTGAVALSPGGAARVALRPDHGITEADFLNALRRRRVGTSFPCVTTVVTVSRGHLSLSNQKGSVRVRTAEIGLMLEGQAPWVLR